MSATTDDAGLLAHLRASVEELRAAEFTVARAAAAVDASDLPAVSGYRSGRRLVEEIARVDPAVATRWVRHGQGLSPGSSFTGEPTEPAWPATAKAAEAGTVGADHVRVIARTMDTIARIPGLDAEATAGAETTLAEAATRLSPHALEKAATRLRGYLDPDGVAPPDPPHDTDELRLSTSRRDGALTFTGRIHSAADKELISEVFDALSAPAGPDDHRSVHERRAHALVELAEQATAPGGIAAHDDDTAPEDTAADHPAPDEPAADTADEASRPDKTPAAGPARGRPLLMITIDHRDLAKQIGHGLLDSDRTIAASEARRLGCDAGIVPMVLGSRSQPLDVGRLAYTIPDGMRRALHQRDRGCCFPGCDRRPRRCQGHHVVHWADGGPTQIDNLALLCRFHHQLIHHGDWRLEMRQGRPWFVPPSWIDPLRTPRPGGPHPPGP